MSDYLEHHGIKNQRWYHRRFQNADGSLTPAGKERYGEWKPGQYKKTKLNVVRDDDGRKKYKIESEDGTSVGDITTTHQSGEALRVNWISVNKDHKREGYASSAMNSLIQDAKERGYKKVTVVIPTGSKDVQHIYERLGFTASKEGLTTDEIADSITSLGDVVKLEYSLEHSDFLEHYGVGHLQGGHSGRYPWGSGKNGANRRVFVSGSSKTQFEDNPYYRKELPKPIRDELDKMVADSANIIVGDAPGIDRQVQDYLKTLNYENVSVYGPGKKLRYLANENWTARPIDAPEFEPMSPEWLAKKDIAMEKAATEGLAVILDEGANATRNNIKRLQESGKEVKVYELNKASAELDHWVDKLLDEVKHEDELGEYLEHYGVGPDDNPPGRGSGRFAKGTGERPFQHDPVMQNASNRRRKKWGIFERIRQRKEKAAAEHAEAAKRSEEDRQLTEAKNKAEALKKKRLEALNKARAIKKANADKAAVEKAAKEKYEAEKKEAIDSGDPEKIAKYLKDLTNQEQIDAINRIGNTAKIKALADEQKRAFKAAEDARIAAEKALEEANRPKTKAEIREQKFNEAISKIQNASNKLDKLRDSGEKIIKFYNMAASVNNALNDKVKLPKIDLGPNQKKDSDKKDKQDADKKEKEKQQNNGGSKGGDTYNTTHDSHDTYNTYNNYGWDDYTERFYKQYQDQPNSGEWKTYESQGLLLLEDFSKRKK